MTMEAIDESDSKFHYNSAVVTLLITSIIMLMVTVVLITNLSMWICKSSCGSYDNRNNW